MIKRGFDIVSALAGMAVIWPIFLAIAVLIKLDSPGPIFYRQVRVGRGLRPFRIFKFRSMVHGADAIGAPLTVGEDSRITRIGRFLRQNKLDELPQLLNILSGDMSVVGPRPEVPRYVELFRSEYAKILTVRPGLTDLASLKFVDEAAILGDAADPETEYRNTILPEKIRLAKLYTRRASLFLDIAIIIQTLLSLCRVPVVVCEVPELKVRPSRVESSNDDKWPGWILRQRRLLLFILDFGLIIFSNYMAFWLRFDGMIPPSDFQGFLNALPWLIAFRGLAFSYFRLHEGLWRYTSLWDFRNIIFGVATSTLAFYLWIHVLLRELSYPASIYVIDTLLLVGFLTGVRLSARLLRDKIILRHRRRVLIVGAGDSGERVVREMKAQGASPYEPVGLLDEDVSLVHKRIHGVKVLGATRDIPRILSDHEPDEVIVALDHPKPAFMRDLLCALEPFRLSLKTLPSMHELLAETSVVSQMRKVDVADLLPRAPVNFDDHFMSEMVRGKRILITGAGGSIGSELARQIVALRPQELILYERHENSLYTIQKELEDKGCSSCVVPVIGDVTDVRRFAVTMELHRPDILFHAAAHKHVPLVELNPAEAMRNNCMGTRIAAELSHRYGVERFVLISTDKAVNPSSMMGATKRVAELIVQDFARRSRTSFLTVRFGNVLGSNGSVLLRFREQIQSGGPVTVTHPAIRRYFMLIPEAVHLVLQAASLGEQGAIYVLDMGEQIPLVDLARNLIRLSGFVPDEEIGITFIGLRPGEKLYEELVGEGEIAEPSRCEKLLRIRTVVPVDAEILRERLITLEAASHMKSADWMIEQLRELIPSFRLSENGGRQQGAAAVVATDQPTVSAEPR